jgi:hypothetical protein
MFTGNAASALFSLAAGLLLFLWGAAARKIIPIIAGSVTVFVGAMFGYDAVVRLVVSSSWIDLAIVGASAIALGSILDRHGAAMKIRLQRWYERSDEQIGTLALDERQSG